MKLRRTFLMCSIAGVVVAMTGCADPQTRASLKEWGVTVPDSPFATAKQPRSSAPQYPVPPSIDVGSFKNDAAYDWLVGMWVAQARDDNEQLDRAARAYQDILDEMEMRQKAGFTPDQVRATALAMVKARISAAPKMPPPYYMTMPRFDGPVGSSSAFSYGNDRVVAIQAGSMETGVYFMQPAKYRAKRTPTSQGAWGMMQAISGSSYKGKTLIDRVEIRASAVEKMTTGPLSPERTLAIQRASSDRQVWAVVTGGYLSADQIVCKEPAPDKYALQCRFVTTGQNMAPISLGTRS
jgi:hypothetical protein